MKIQQMDTQDALVALKTSRNGLSQAEATRRLAEYGRNAVQGIRREPAWLRFFRELTHFFAVIMWLAAALALVAEWESPGQGMAKVGIAIVVVIIVSALFSFFQEFRVEKSLAALRDLLPDQVFAFRDGIVRELPSSQLVPGDIVQLEQGDYVPADCRVIEAWSLGVNNATVTGESLVQLRQAVACAATEIINADNMLLAGTSVVAGKGHAVVFATGMRTEFGRIAHLTDSSGEQTSPLRREIAHLSRVIAGAAIGLGMLFFIVGRFIGVPLWQDMLFAIGIIVAMVPEGLLPTLTLALVLAAQRMVKRNVLIRHLPAIETLGSTTVICTDKTGTLTQNRMHVAQVLLGERLCNVDALADDLVKDYGDFFDGASVCHNLGLAQTGEWAGDPMEVALHDMAVAQGRDAVVGERMSEVPFDATRMRLSVVQQTESGARLYCKGAPEKLLPLCSHVLVDGKHYPMDAAQCERIAAAQNAMAGMGLRVIAFAGKPFAATRAATADDESGLLFCGLAGLEDPPRPEVPAAIQQCHDAGIRIIMVTGDHPRTALAIAQQTGLVRKANAVVIDGEQLRYFTTAELHAALDTEDIVFARVAADQKMQIVQALKDKQHVVAVTGDGVNDAPALKAAHIGVAMGVTGTDVAREAADMILLDDNFASIVNGIEEGRAVFANIRKFLTYILAHNVAELVPYLAFVLFRVPLALTPIQILAVDMGADSLTAVGLGAEKPDPDVMKRPPRKPDERLMDFSVVLRAYAFLGLFEAVACMTIFFMVLLDNGWHYGQMPAVTDPVYVQATTACFGAIILLQVVNVFLCRSDTLSVFRVGLAGNRLILAGVALEIAVLLLVCYTPPGNLLVGTAPLPVVVWWWLLPFAVLMLVLDEVRKWRVRRFQ